MNLVRILCLCFIFISAIGFGQKKGLPLIDSMHAALPAITQDTTRINTYNKLAIEYDKQNNKQAETFADMALKQAGKINYKKGMLSSYTLKGIFAANNLKYDSALAYYQQALDISEKIGDNKHTGIILGNMGIILCNQSNYPKALEYHFRALKFKQETGNKLEIARTFSAIGSTYEYSRNYNKALEYYHKSLEIAEHEDAKNFIVMLYGNIGTIYSYEHNNTKAFYYYNKQLVLAKELNNLSSQARALSNMALIQINLNEFSEALQNISVSKPIFEKSGDIAFAALDYTHLGLIYLNLAKPDFTDEVDDSLKNKARNLKTALFYINKAYSIDSQFNLMERIAGDYQVKANILILMGNYKEATVALKSANLLKDSIFALENQKQMQSLEAKRIAEVKDEEIKIEHIQLANARSQRLYLLAGMLMLSLLCAVLYNRFLIKKKSNDHLTEANNIKSKLFSIVSHDLRHPINSLEASLRVLEHKESDNKEIKDLTSNLMFSVHATSNLLDNLLTWSKSEMMGAQQAQTEVNLSDMAEETFSFYQAAATYKNVQLQNCIDQKTTVHADPNVIRMVMRNLLDNAIKFTRPGGIITIKSTCHEGFTQFSITDNGIGMPAVQLEKLFDFDEKAAASTGTAMEPGTGLGLSLCYDVIKKSGGAITVESIAGKGTTFFVNLPEAVIA